jgi:hypothetical protein
MERKYIVLSFGLWAYVVNGWSTGIFLNLPFKFYHKKKERKKNEKEKGSPISRGEQFILKRTRSLLLPK